MQHDYKLDPSKYLFEKKTSPIFKQDKMLTLYQVQLTLNISGQKLSQLISDNSIKIVPALKKYRSPGSRYPIAQKVKTVNIDEVRACL